MLFFLRLEAVTAPEEREQLLYNLNKYMTEADKLAQAGNFDLEMDRHPEIDIQLDPNDIKHFQ